MAKLNMFALVVLATIACAGFQHLIWWVPVLAGVVGFLSYQFDKASIGIMQLVRTGGVLGGAWYLLNLAVLYGVVWAVGYGLSLLF